MESILYGIILFILAVLALVELYSFAYERGYDQYSKDLKGFLELYKNNPNLTRADIADYIKTRKK